MNKGQVNEQPPPPPYQVPPSSYYTPGYQPYMHPNQAAYPGTYASAPQPVQFAPTAPPQATPAQNNGNNNTGMSQGLFAGYRLHMWFFF